jgi:hypothetical protein
MATREEPKVSKVYLEVKKHSIVEVSKEPRVNSDGVEFERQELLNPKTNEKVIKYYDFYPGITGFIEKIEVYDTEQNFENRYRGVKLHIDNDAVLDLQEKSAGYDVFCRTAENIDFSQKVTLSAYHNRSKDRTGFKVEQNGESIQWNYTKDNPGDCPPWKKNAMGEWDSSDQRAFFQQLLEGKISAAVEAAAAARRGEEPDTVPETTAETVDDTAKPKAKAAKAAKAVVDSDEIPF